jgi:shikimate kinase
VITDKIYLVGFMAAGKTSVGRELARRLGWQAIDIDQLIETQEQMGVTEIFAKHGEAYFRAAERAAVARQVGLRHVVVATGGGTFADPRNRALINEDGLSVWLDVSLERAISRVPAGGRRPLATDRSEFERLYASRREAYAQAHVRIDANRGSVGALVDELLERLKGTH